MKKFLILFLFCLVPTLAFSKGEVIVIAIENGEGVYENGSREMKKYFEKEYGATVQIAKYSQLPSLKLDKVDGLVIMNGDRKSGYAPEIETYTKNATDKNKVVVSNWYTGYGEKVVVDPQLNGVDVVTTSSTMRQVAQKNSVFAEVAKQLGLKK